MCGLARTDLTTSQKAQLAASALGGQGIYGRITEAANRFEVSRPTAYRAGQEAQEVLNRHFASEAIVAIDEAQIRRTIVALRVMAPNSLRAIEDLLPIVYPGVKLSYGKIQEICAQAEQAAAAFNVQADLSGIDAGALDEMFSQGDPVLAGVDLDSGYLFALALRDSRSAEDWAKVLGDGKNQGLALKTVVKDAARGIAGGVAAVFPDAEQRDDCFHALYRMGQVQQQLERAAYAAIDGEIEAEYRLKKALGKLRPPSRERIQCLRQKLNRARIVAGHKMAAHDKFERASQRVREAMELVDLERGELREPDKMQAEIEAAAQPMIDMSNHNCQVVGRYIQNRAPGLVLYAAELREQFAGLAKDVGEISVTLACIVWRLMHELRLGRRHWDRHHLRQHLVGAYALLTKNAGAGADRLLETVDGLWQKRHRASSAIEGFNAFLRPFLYVHKGVTQGFLELLRAYYNLRVRRWGRHKGTSAQQTLLGEPAGDWLSLIGFPPSAAVN